MGCGLDSLPAEVLTNIIHMSDMDVRQMVSLKFMGRVWNDAAGRAIQMIDSLNLSSRHYGLSDLKRMARALDQKRLPEFFRLKKLTICVPTSESERRVIAHILRQASKSLHQLTIQHTSQRDYQWLRERMADLMFPQLRLVNTHLRVSYKLVNDIIDRCLQTRIASVRINSQWY